MPDVQEPSELPVNDLLVAALEEMPEPAAPPVDNHGGSAQDDLLGSVAAGTAGETTLQATEPQKAPAETATSAGVPTPDDFSDEKPWTPERVKNAKALLEQQKAEAEEARTKAHDLYQEAIGRAKKFQRRYDNFQAEKSAHQVDKQQFLAAVQAIRQGTPEQRLVAIQNLTGQDGLQWFQEMTLEMATGGKARQVDPAVARVQAELQALRAEREAEREQMQLHAEARQLQAAVEGWKDAITAEVAKHPEAFPLSANIATKVPARYRETIFAVKEAEFRARGNPIDDAEAVRILEGHLRAERDLYHPNGTTGSGPAADETTAAANLRTTPSAPQLTTSLGTEPGGGKRPLTEREAIAAVASELPDEFYSSLLG